MSAEPESSFRLLGRDYRARDQSPVDSVERCLTRIESTASTLNAFNTVLPERALQAAERAEREIFNGDDRGALHGIPIAIKDNIFTKNVRTTMGSRVFRDLVPDHSASIVKALESAGAIIIGKTNTHEFAYGGTGDVSWFGATRNPHNPACITGGSSGGSAAAVAGGCVPGAVGTDTGGSVRIPAALCGLVGMKPTFGRVSKHGVFPVSWTTDHVGPMTQTVEDNAIMLSIMAGRDSNDPYSSDREGEDFTRDLNLGVSGGVVGLATSYYFDSLDPDVQRSVRQAAEMFTQLGADVREVHVADMEETVESQRLTMTVEAYAVHAKRLDAHVDDFQPEVRDRLLEGRTVEAHRYAAAQQTRHKTRNAFANALSEVDVLVTPTTAIPSTPVGSRIVRIRDEEESVRTALNRLTGPTSFIGLPSLSVPCGVSSDDLPVGLQIIGRPFDEATVYRYGHAYSTACA